MAKMERQVIHFSFDDVHSCLKDIMLKTGKYQSIFENEKFGWMKRMHDNYGAVFSLYTFNYFSGDPTYDISDLSDYYANELRANAHWLKFGFHAKDDLKKYLIDEPENIKIDYEKFCNAILHASHGDTNCIDRVIRLGWFAGTKKNVFALRDLELGIKGLLSADDDRLPYYFGAEITQAINRTGELWLDNLLFLRSQLVMEIIWTTEELIEKIQGYTEPKVIEIFSHEYCFGNNSRVEGYTMLELYEFFIKWAYDNGYGFGFAQELYDELK